jgi:hypothetical protein
MRFPRVESSVSATIADKISERFVIEAAGDDFRSAMQMDRIDRNTRVSAAAPAGPITTAISARPAIVLVVEV